MGERCAVNAFLPHNLLLLHNNNNNKNRREKSKTHWFIINVLYLRRAPSVLFSRVIQTRIYVLDGELTHSGLCFFLFCAHGCMISLSVLHQYFVGLVSTKLHSNFLASDNFFLLFSDAKEKKLTLKHKYSPFWIASVIYSSHELLSF